MNPILRSRLLAVTGAGAMAVAGVLQNYHEGRIYTPYIDPAGILTVCEGITGPDVIKGKTYTDAECDALGAKHRAFAEAAAKTTLIHYGTYNQWRQGALIDFTYNVGAANLASSTLARRFNAGDDVGGCNELVKWSKARVKGVLTTLKGLLTRRQDETELCLGWK